MNLDDIKTLLDQLVADVERAIAAINELNEKLAAAEDPEKLQAIADSIAASSASLEAVLPPQNPTP